MLFGLALALLGGPLTRVARLSHRLPGLHAHLPAVRDEPAQLRAEGGGRAGRGARLRGAGRDPAAQRHDPVARRRRARDREPLQRPALAAGDAGDRRALRVAAARRAGGGAPLLVLLAVPMAIAGNALRITLLVLMAHYVGIKQALGLFHDVSGYLTYGLSLAGLLAAWALLQPRRPARTRRP